MNRWYDGTMHRWNVSALLALLSIVPSFHLSAQDTSAIDRGVRVGIIYRPGVRPGFVLLPRQGGGLDSVRAIIARDLDYSDRFEVITLPGGDSIRLDIWRSFVTTVSPPSCSRRSRLRRLTSSG